MIALDHLAIGATDLDRGAADVEAALGVPLEPGGRHATMGTWNRLLSLGPGEYLEVIAPDPDAPAPDRPRWFALDSFEGRTRPRAWVLRCDDMDGALVEAPPGTGRQIGFARDDLRWVMTVPDDGQLPFGGLSPAFIQWQSGRHPAEVLPDRGVRLAALTLTHPRARDLRAALSVVLADPRVEVVAGAKPEMSVTLSTPSGPVVL